MCPDKLQVIIMKALKIHVFFIFSPQAYLQDFKDSNAILEFINLSPFLKYHYYFHFPKSPLFSTFIVIIILHNIITLAVINYLFFILHFISLHQFFEFILVQFDFFMLDHFFRLLFFI